MWTRILLRKVKGDMNQRRADNQARRGAAPALRVSVIVIAIVGCALVGCAAQPAARAQQGGRATVDAAVRFTALENVERKQERQPDAQAQQAPAPLGAAVIAPASAGLVNGRSDASLATLIHDLAGQFDSQIGAPPQDVDVDADQRSDAIRLYVQGRAKLLAGDIRGAMSDLQDAAKLDGSAAAPWRELGAAALRAGDRFSATAAFRQALQRDRTDLESLARLGLLLAAKGDREQAAVVLARARISLDGQDEALPFLLDRGLGDSLLAIGATRAAVEAFRRAASLPVDRAIPTRFARELAQLERDRSEIWRHLGDAQFARGNLNDALAAYEQALDLPSVDPGAVRAQAVFTAMRLGRSAKAAALALSGLVAPSGGVDDRALQLVKFIAEHSAVRRQISRALDDLLASQPADGKAVAAIALARSAIMTADEAIVSLRKQLEQAPANEKAMWELRRRLQAKIPAEQASFFVALTARAPLHVELYVKALLNSKTPSPAFIDALTAPETLHTSGVSPQRARRAAALLRAHALLASGHRTEGMNAVAALLERAPDFQPALLAQVQLLGEQGKFATAHDLLERMAGQRDPVDVVLFGAALEAAHQPQTARAALQPIIADTTLAAVVRSDALLLDALAAQRWGDAKTAHQQFLALIALDPTREEAYAGLVSLHGPAGLAPDRAALAQAVRALRDAVPGSRLLRWLHAQDLMGEGRFDQAQRELRQLAEERIEPNVVALLTSIWLRAGATDKAQAWLSAQMAVLPNATSLAAAFAQVVAATGESARAVELLDAQLASHPSDATLLRAMESILRDKMDKKDEADHLALRRLDASSRTPEALAERAGADMRLKRTDDAAAALHEALAWDAPFTLAQRAALTAQVATIAQGALRDGTPSLSVITGLFDTLARRVTPMPVQVHLVRLEAMLRNKETAPASFADAIALAVAQHPKNAAVIAGSAFQRALEAGRSALVAGSAPVVDAHMPTADSRLHTIWLQAAADAHDLDSGLAVLAAIESRKTGLDIISQLRGNFIKQPTTQAQAAAELAYQLSGSFFVEDEQGYERLLRWALSRDPNHALANNDLGYQMADRGDDLATAHKMLTRAYRLAPNRPEILDSVAWVRYKLGMLKDQVAADGAKTDGAITLLRKATTLTGGSSDPVVRDHFGDTLWRIGEHDEAIKQWRIAHSLANARLVSQSQRTVGTDKAILSQTQQKINAAAAGGRPSVAPLQGESSSTTTTTPAGAAGNTQ